jgi:hypothetical protein
MPLSTIFHVLTVSWTIRSKDADQDALFGARPPNKDKPIGECKIMNGKLIWGLAICLVGPLCAGCATTPGVIRGQSPADRPAASAAAPPPASSIPVSNAGGPNACQQCGGTDGDCSPNCLPHHSFYYHYTGPEKGCCLEGSCLSGCCCLRNGCCCLQPYSDCLPDCLTNRGPLVYPQNPSPGAIVQYPYYCCKGPDDFFLQK